MGNDGNKMLISHSNISKDVLRRYLDLFPAFNEQLSKIS